MAYAVALSAHPVSSQATGEVIGQLFEAVGPNADLVVLLATPGHRGALEDIAAAARRLLAPGVLLAAVTTGLGAGEDYIEHGPGLAAWSGSCEPVAPVGRGSYSRADFEPTGMLLLGCEDAERDVSEWPGVLGHVGPMTGRGGERRPGFPVVVGAVAGPVILDGAPPCPGPVGVVFGPRSGFSTAVVRGLRPVGPDLTVSRADGTMVYELDGQPAFRRLVDVVRDGMPAVELPTLAQRLHLCVTATGPAAGTDPTSPARTFPDPTPVLGVDRANGALAVGEPVAIGATVRFALSDPAAVRAALARSMAARPEGALILTPAGSHPTATAGRGDGLDTDGFVDGGPPLPSVTLICATAPLKVATTGRSALPVATTSVAYFSRPARRY